MDQTEAILIQELRKITDPLAIRVIDLKAKRGKNGMNIHVVVDKDGGVTLDDCERITNLLNARMDVLRPIGDENYSLQLSSPGLYRVLRNQEEYELFKGKKVLMTLREPSDKDHPSTVLEGILEGMEHGTVRLSVAGEMLGIPLDKILRTKLNG